jgi:hypothetical protein
MLFRWSGLDSGQAYNVEVALFCNTVSGDTRYTRISMPYI